MSQPTNYTNTYLDTRGSVSGLTFTEALLQGIAPGGGLFVPQEIPQISPQQLAKLATLAYPELAAWVYQIFGVDLPAPQISALMAEAYGTNFDDQAIAPLRSIAPKTHVLELWHGPTSAFKDMALQCLPLFFSAAIEKQRGEFGEVAVPAAAPATAASVPAAPESAPAAAPAPATPAPAAADYLILVATSGDTGKAALEGFADRSHTGIVVFYPQGGVSDIQQLQMTTQRGANVNVLALEGNFDDCQTTVKQVFNDAAFNEKLAKEHNVRLSSANSINWGRLLPQVVYYLSAYLQLVNSGELKVGEPIDVCVPTGNFGNILAAWYARAMGLPIERLLCASNDNRVLTDFINSGCYDISQRDFVLTPSPSMDILVSSNLERQLFELCHRDPQRIRDWMADLRDQRRFTVDKETFAALRACFSADWVSAEESLETIREVYDSYGYLLDPHSAVAWKVAERNRGVNPVVVVSTAHWAKFGADVCRALAGIAANDPLPAKVAALGGLGIAEHVLCTHPQAAELPAPLRALANLPVRFDQVVEGSAAAAEQAVYSWLGNRARIYIRNA